MTHPDLIEVNIGITPEAAISGAVLLQTEQRAFLTFNAMRDTTRPFPHGGFYKEEAGTAIIELIGCTITKFGYAPLESACCRPTSRSSATSPPSAEPRLS